jgi:hypothetical protein
VAIKTVKTLDIKMPYPIEMKRLMGKWRCRVKKGTVKQHIHRAQAKLSKAARL